MMNDGEYHLDLSLKITLYCYIEVHPLTHKQSRENFSTYIFNVTSINYLVQKTIQ